MGLTRVGVAGAAALTLLSGVGGCASREETDDPRDYSGRLVRGEVEVEARLEHDQLSVTLTPQRRGFHVYSVDLPADGVEGLGVATTVRALGGIRATSRPRADQPVRELEYPSLGLALPVYSDGPVTLSFRVDRSPSTPRVRVTYAACSTSRCLPPVRDAEVPLRP